MKLPKPIPKYVVWGLGLGLVVGIGLGMRLQSAGLGGLASSRAERSAIVGLGAVAEIVETQGVDSEGLQAAVERFVERDPVLTEVRVVRFKGIRLVASTAGSWGAGWRFRFPAGEQSVRVAPRLTVSSNDELGALGENFNQMTEGLKDRYRLRQSLDLAKE